MAELWCVAKINCSDGAQRLGVLIYEDENEVEFPIVIGNLTFDQALKESRTLSRKLQMEEYNNASNKYHMIFN